MLPVIAIVGRVNVGKSTLFNHLTQSRRALIADQPGLTRDRQYGYGYYDDQSFIVIDTGGIGDEQNTLNRLITTQCEKAISEADMILFLVDAQTGITSSDEQIAYQLRITSKPVLLVANKIDRTDIDTAIAEFYSFGLGEPIPLSALHHQGFHHLLQKIFSLLPTTQPEESGFIEGIKIAIVGKPNVGKSTLVNYLLEEERMIVSDQPGTTRDSIFIPFKYGEKPYTLIDTAGIRRRSKISDKIEKFSMVKTLQAISECHVVLFMMDGQACITDQDLKLISLVLDEGKALVIAINKWDLLSTSQRLTIKEDIEYKFKFLDFAKRHFISAQKGFDTKRLFASIEQAYAAATKPLSTPQLTRILQQLVESHSPPLIKGRRIKLRYAHAGGRNPPVIVIHGNQLEALPSSYKRYLEHGFRKALHLTGTPIRIELKTGKNPYKSSLRGE